MSYWSWDSSLSVGIDVIDAQHRRIIDYINELDAAKRHNDVEKVSEVLMGLVDYTRTHFLYEEGLMKQAGYPLTDEHRKVHTAFVRNISDYVDLHSKGKDVSRRLMSDLKIWLTTHIKNDDKDFGLYSAKAKKKSRIRRLFNPASN